MQTNLFLLPNLQVLLTGSVARFISTPLNSRNRNTTCRRAFFSLFHIFFDIFNLNLCMILHFLHRSADTTPTSLCSDMNLKQLTEKKTY